MTNPKGIEQIWCAHSALGDGACSISKSRGVLKGSVSISSGRAGTEMRMSNYIRVIIGIMEKKMETTTLYGDYIGVI